MEWQCLLKTNELVVVSNGSKMRAFHRGYRFRELIIPRCPEILHSLLPEFFNFQVQGLSLLFLPKLLGGGGSSSKSPQTLKEFYDEKKADYDKILLKIELYRRNKEFEEAIGLAQTSISTLMEEINNKVIHGNIEEDHTMTSNDFSHSCYRLVGFLYTSEAKCYDSMHRYEEAIESLLKAKQYLPSVVTRDIERKVLSHKNQFYSNMDRKVLIQSIIDKRLGSDIWKQIGVDIEDPPVSAVNLLPCLEHLDNNTLMSLCLVLVIRDINGQPLDLDSLNSYYPRITNEQGDAISLINRKSFSSSEWVCFSTDGTNTILTERLCESFPGFIPSQPLEFVQCTILYQIAYGTSATDKIIVFHDEVIYGIPLNIQCDSANIIVGAPNFVKQPYSFIIKPVMCDQETSAFYGEIIDYCKATYDRYKSLPPDTVEDIKTGNYNNEINNQIEDLRQRALEDFNADPNSPLFVEVNFKYLKKMIDNMNILKDLDPELELLNMVDQSKQFFGFYMPFQNTVRDSEGNFAFDSSAHGPSCALQTGLVFDGILSMCFQRGSSYVVHQEYLWEVVKLFGCKRIITCKDTGKRNGGTRRLIPLLMYLALVGGLQKVIKFIEVFWREDSQEGKSAVMELMNPKFRKKNRSSKLAVYKQLPGYSEVVCEKLKGRVNEQWRNKLCEAFSN